MNSILRTLAAALAATALLAACSSMGESQGGSQQESTLGYPQSPNQEAQGVSQGGSQDSSGGASPTTPDTTTGGAEGSPTGDLPVRTW